MARINNLHNFLTDVATAIKTKKGISSTITPANFDTLISSIDGGGNIKLYASTTEMNADTSATEGNVGVVFSCPFVDPVIDASSGYIYFPKYVYFDVRPQDVTDRDVIKNVSVGQGIITITLDGGSCSMVLTTNGIDITLASYSVVSTTSGWLYSRTSDAPIYNTGNGTFSQVMPDVAKSFVKYSTTATEVSFAIYDYVGGAWRLKEIYNDLGYSGTDASKILNGYKAYTNDGLVLGNHVDIDTSDANAVATDILLNKTAYVNDIKITGSMANNGALSYTPTTSSQSIPAGYTSGGTISAVTSSIDTNITAGNIASGVTILRSYWNI